MRISLRALTSIFWLISFSNLASADEPVIRKWVTAHGNTIEAYAVDFEPESEMVTLFVKKRVSIRDLSETDQKFLRSMSASQHLKEGGQEKPPPSKVNLVDQYMKYLKTSGIPDDFVKKASVQGLRLTLAVDDAWHQLPYQQRLQFSQILWKLWAGLSSPKSPDLARISITDANGNEVAGSRILAGSLIWATETK